MIPQVLSMYSFAHCLVESDMNHLTDVSSKTTSKFNLFKKTSFQIKKKQKRKSHIQGVPLIMEQRKTADSRNQNILIKRNVLC